MVGALAICAAAYPNDFLIQSNWLVGCHLPVAVYGFLLLFALAGRPLLRRIHPSLAFNNGETVVVIALMLAACGVDPVRYTLFPG